MTRVVARDPNADVMVEDHVTLSECILHGPVRLGYRSYANGAHLRNVVIGRFCSIGRRTTIGAPHHPLDRLTTHPIILQPDETPPRTWLGNDVWIGDGSVILAGVTIGDGAVVGANAVVSRDVAPYAVVAGVPARQLRRRFCDDEIARLLESQWWRYGDIAPSCGDLQAALSAIVGAPELAPHHRPLINRGWASRVRTRLDRWRNRSSG